MHRIKVSERSQAQQRGDRQLVGNRRLGLSGNSVLTNSGTFTIQGRDLSGAGTFANTGTLFVSANAGTAQFINARAEQPGILDVKTGTFEAAAGGIMSGSVILTTARFSTSTVARAPSAGPPPALPAAGSSPSRAARSPRRRQPPRSRAQSVQFQGAVATVAPTGHAHLQGHADPGRRGNEVIAGAGTFKLAGTVIQNDPQPRARRASTGTTRTKFTIAPGSSYQFGSDSGIVNGGNAGGLVTNSGTISKTGGTGISTISTTMNSTGAIVVNKGTMALALAGGTMNGGVFTVSPGAVLDLTGTQTVNYSGSFSGTGAGQIQLNGGTLNVTGGTAGASFSFPSGAFVWNGGTINTNASPLNIPSGGSFQLSGNTGLTLLGTAR